MNELIAVLDLAVENYWTDIHITIDASCFYRKDNKLYRLDNCIFTLNDFDFFLSKFVDKIVKERIEKAGVADFAFTFKQRRFRFNIYKIYESYAIAIRIINKEPILLEKYKQACVLKEILAKNQGLVLICGATGTGKSSTLAAMIDFINRNQTKHIITLEDPIEYIFKNEDSLIHQREYERDFYSFSEAIKMAMRQDPDVIMVGEIRDKESMKACLNAAETGHLVLGTLHASSAIEALMRIESFFGNQQLDAIRMQLAMSINSIIVQNLVPLVNGGLYCCMEILLSTYGIKNLINKGQYNQIISQMQLNKIIGMQFMKDDIIYLLKENLINKEVAKEYIDM